MKEHMEIVWVVVFGLVAGTVLSSLVGFFAARWLALVATVPVGLLVPVIVIFILAGSFAIRQNFWDMLVSIASGVLGYFLTRFGFSLLPLIIGFLLGTPAEVAFVQSLHISQGSPLIFFMSPLSVTLLLSVLAVGFYPLFQRRRTKGTAR